MKALNEICVQYVGELLYFKVYAGWGWQRIEPDAPLVGYLEAAGPPDFHIRLRYFFRWRSVLRGAVGRIEEAGHPYDGYWIIFSSQSTGVFNFTDYLATYTVHIQPTEPAPLDSETASTAVEHWDARQFSGSPQLLGFGVVAVTPRHVKKWEEYRLKH